MNRFLGMVLIVFLFASLYVFQQSSILECSYGIYACDKTLSLLIDQKNQLIYNVARLEGPAHLEETTLAKGDFDVYVPKAQEYIRLTPGFVEPPVPSIINGPIKNTGTILLSMFSLSSEAIAKEAND